MLGSWNNIYPKSNFASIVHWLEKPSYVHLALEHVCKAKHVIKACKNFFTHIAQGLKYI